MPNSEPKTTRTRRRIQCPVRRETENALSAGKNTLKALRRLHKSLKSCQECPAWEDCLLSQLLNDQINEVIAEINAEWEVEL